MTATVTAAPTSLHRLLPGSDSVAKIWEWFEASRESVFDDFSQTSLDAFAYELRVRAKTEITWLICFGNEPVGYLGFAPHNPTSGQFRGLVIAPEYRGQGIGTAAFIGALEFLQSKGFRSFLSMPFADNFAIKKLLLKVGFVCTGTLPGATQRDGMPLGVSVFHLYKGDA